MRRRTLAAASVLVLTAAIGGPAHGAVAAYVPLEGRLAEADLVVQGTVLKETGIIRRVGLPFVVADVEVTKVFKGPAETKSIKLAWMQPQPGLVVTAGAVRYAVGQSGIWILKFDAKEQVHLAETPGDLIQADLAATVTEKLAAIEQLAWSAPTNGLQMATFVDQQPSRPGPGGRPVKGAAAAYVLVRNVGQAATFVNRYPLDRPLKVELHGPDGKPVPLDLYGPRNAPVPPLQLHFFVAVAPGQTRGLAGFPLGTLPQTGAYELSVTYASQREAKEFDIETWRGELATTKTTFRTSPGGTSSTKTGPATKK